MGGKQSTTIEHPTRLTMEETAHMTELFEELCGESHEHGCSYEQFEAYCEILHPLLARFVLDYYFANPKCMIKSLKEFTSLFLFLVRGTIGERAQAMLVMLLGILHDSHTNECESGASYREKKFMDLKINYTIERYIFRSRVNNYFRGLICSYIKLEYFGEAEEFWSWRKVKSSFTTADVDRITRSLGSGCQVPKSIEDFEKWVTKWTTTKCLLINVYNQFFRVERIHPEILNSLFPTCVSKRSLSSVLDMCSILHINCHLPPKCRNQWKLLFASSVHGVNYRHILGRILNHGPTLVVIKDKGNSIFGGFAAESWTTRTGFYGDCHSFLFQISPNLEVYEPTGRDEKYQCINIKQHPHGLGMGGGTTGHYGWWIEPEILRGSCAVTCSTFENPILSSSESFKVSSFEIWGVLAPKTRAKKRGLMKFHAMSTLRESAERGSNMHKSISSAHKDGYNTTRASKKFEIMHGDSSSSSNEIEEYTDESDSDDDDEISVSSAELQNEDKPGKS